jgi:heavy metal translocating P-type ATPase
MTCCHAEPRTATPRADATTAHNQLSVRWVWLRIIFAGFLAGNSMTWALAVNVSSATERERMLLHLGLLATTVVVGLLVGGRLLLDSLLALFRFRLSTELLFLCGCLGALAISLWSMIRGSGPVYFEVVSILLVIYRIGVELKAGAKRHALRAADALSPALNYCEVVREGGRTETCLIESVRAGDAVRCHPGELVPIDGTVHRGQAFVREAAVTGETFMVTKRPGDTVHAGSDLIDATLVVRASGPGNRRMVDRIIRAVESAREKPTRLEQTAELYARWFLPVVATAAIGTFAVWSYLGDVSIALFNALSVLVVACPCAFGFAAPVAVWSAVTRIARRGLVIRRNDAVERLAQVDTVIFDKTGTLTQADPILKAVRSFNGLATDQLVTYAGSLEAAVKHPIGEAFRRDGQQRLEVRDVEVLGGVGVAGTVVDGLAMHRVEVGTLESLAGPGCEQALVEQARAELGHYEGDHELGIRVDGALAGIAVVGETALESNESAIDALGDLDIRVSVFSGDSNLHRLGRLPADDVRGAMTPAAKAAAVRRFTEEGRKSLFVGDGVNDASAMAAAHVSVAVETGSTLAAETADILWTNQDLTAIPDALDVCRQTVQLLRSNLRFALGYNLLGMTIAAAGWMHPVFAAVLMLCSSLFVTLRGARICDPPQEQSERTPGRPALTQLPTCC